MQFVSKKKKKKREREIRERGVQKITVTFTKCFSRLFTRHLSSSLCLRFWHKGVGKANHVIEKEKRKSRVREEEEEEMTQVRAQVVAKSSPGVGWCQSDGFSYLIPETEL